MKAKIQKLYVVALLLFAQALWAHDFQTNGIYYNITDSTRHTVEVTRTYPSLYAYRDTVVIPDSVLHDSVYYHVTGIGYGAFENCWNLIAVVLPNSIKYIEQQSFNSCTGLLSITIPNSVDSIGSGAFAVCTSLSSIVIPNSVYSIGHGTFAVCTGLTSIVIPNSVKTIGYTAFAGCSRLNHVFIGDSVETIGYGAFRECGSLDSIAVSSNNRFFTSINGMLCNYRGDTLHCCPSGKNGNVIVPSSITCILKNAFYKSNATAIDLPNSLVTIATDAFLNCDSLTSIVIPDSVKYIGEWNFYGCNQLKSVVVGKNVDTIDDHAFLFVGLDLLMFRKANTVSGIGLDADMVIVPCGSYSWYSNYYSSNIIVESDYLFMLETQDSNKGVAYTLTMPSCANPVWVFCASPNNGYEFSHWSDGNTDNPRTLTLTSDVSLTAYFVSNAGLSEPSDDGVSVSSINGRIVVGGVVNERVYVCDVLGRVLSSAIADGSATIEVPQNGVYFVKIGNRPTRKVLVFKK